MPFDPNYKYGTGTQEITHLSVPPKGRTAVSADFIAMYVNGIAVGVVQRFSPRESREVQPIFEIGNIYPVEFVPMTWSGQIEVQRLEIFKDSLLDAFQFNAQLNSGVYDLTQYWPSNKQGPMNGTGPNGFGAGTTGAIVTTIADIQWPIDIQVHITNPAPEVNGITVKTFQECWITGYGSTFDSGAKTVMSNVTFTFRNVQITQATPMNDGSSVGFNTLATGAA